MSSTELELAAGVANNYAQEIIHNSQLGPSGNYLWKVAVGEERLLGKAVLFVVGQGFRQPTIWGLDVRADSKEFGVSERWLVDVIEGVTHILRVNHPPGAEVDFTNVVAADGDQTTINRGDYATLLGYMRSGQAQKVRGITSFQGDEGLNFAT